jgi:hypothetical protein
MRKMLGLVLAISIAFGMAAMAQSGSSTGSKDTSAASAPLKTLKGTMKSEGGKITFVSDKDKKSWDVMNPEALRGHEGHHVLLKAHVYVDKSAIHVMEVKMLHTSDQGQNTENTPETRY